MAYPKFNTSTAAENFKGQLRTAQHQANEAKNYAKALKPMSGCQELEMAENQILQAIEKVNPILDRVARYYNR